MLKFFRKIRKGLLVENKFSKYLLYAIGEILLVVIGILIALQMNSWKQDRIIDKQRAQLKVGLKLDFETTVTSLKDNISILESKILDIDKFLSLVVTTNDTTHFDSLYQLSQSAFMGLSFDPAISRYQMAINTGKITLIKNDEFFYQMTLFLQGYDQYKLIKQYKSSNALQGSLSELKKENPGIFSYGNEMSSIPARFRMTE